MKTHFSPKLKKIAVCRGVCRFGSDTPHFNSMEEGELWLAQQKKDEYGNIPDPKRKKANDKDEKLVLTNANSYDTRRSTDNSWGLTEEDVKQFKQDEAESTRLVKRLSNMNNDEVLDYGPREWQQSSNSEDALTSRGQEILSRLNRNDSGPDGKDVAKVHEYGPDENQLYWHENLPEMTNRNVVEAYENISINPASDHHENPWIVPMIRAEIENRLNKA